MEQRVVMKAAKQVKNARCFLQSLQEDQDFRESLRGLTSAASLSEFIRDNGFSFTEYELMLALVENTEVLAGYNSDGCDCSLYEKGLLELL